MRENTWAYISLSIILGAMVSFIVVFLYRNIFIPSPNHVELCKTQYQVSQSLDTPLTTAFFNSCGNVTVKELML